MYLFERLPDEDKTQFHTYLNHYGNDGDGVIGVDRLGHFLRFWDESKEPFFRAFGEQFIIKKEVRLTKNVDELADEMYVALVNGSWAIREFVSSYKEAIQNINADNGDYDMFYRLKSFVDDYEMLVKNIYEGPGFTIPAKYTKDGRPLVVNTNCKAVKMLGKIVTALGVEMPVWYCPKCGAYHIKERNTCSNCAKPVERTTGYEMFRQAHSQALNQKQIKGNLCLSIHPLDYITMSDNNCGWTSCMSWMDEPGDYRLGTIEMMNSDCVIIAYIESKDKMWTPGGDWNSKRWRQLYIVTREVILGNRQYPYVSDELQGTAIRWIRELMTQIPGYGPYPEETTQLRNGSWNIVKEKRIHFNFYCNYMYNDVYDSRLAFVADQKIDDDDHYSCNFSGPAVCTGCGDIIELDEVDASCVQCRACDGHWKCDFCGDWHSSYDEPYSVDGYLACEWCYTNELEECECCNEMHRTDYMNHIYIQFADTTNTEIRDGFNYNFHIPLCDYCVTHPEEYEPLFGPMYEVKDAWGMTRKAFDIRNIAEDGFDAGNLSPRTIEWLKLMQATKSDEERINLLEKIVY
jgi:hypothetical protein